MNSYSFTDRYSVQHSIGRFSNNYSHNKLDGENSACSGNRLNEYKSVMQVCVYSY